MSQHLSYSSQRHPPWLQPLMSAWPLPGFVIPRLPGCSLWYWCSADQRRANRPDNVKIRVHTILDKREKFPFIWYLLRWTSAFPWPTFHALSTTVLPTLVRVRPHFQPVHKGGNLPQSKYHIHICLSKLDRLRRSSLETRGWSTREGGARM